MLSLAEKTVVVTRPKEQAAELRKALENFGARVVLFPTIEIAPPESYDELDAAVQNFSDYDWIILTSANAAEHFLRRLEANEVDAAELDYLRLCAIGEATFERLRLARVHVDVIPDESRAESVFDALTEYLGDAAAFAGLRFLLPRSNIGRDFLPLKLREAGATVADVAAYQTVLPAHPEIGKLKALLQSGAIDCLTFTSPSTFKNFVQIIGLAELAQYSENIAIACIGETTAQAVRKQNLRVDVISPEAAAAAFAAAIADFYS